MPKYPALDGSQPCRQVDPDLFFPEHGEGGDTLSQVKALCSSCDFKTQCLEYAMQYKMPGIWGGKTEHERRKLASARRIKQQPLHLVDYLPDPPIDMSDEEAFKRYQDRIYQRKVRARAKLGAA